MRPPSVDGHQVNGAGLSSKKSVLNMRFGVWDSRNDQPWKPESLQCQAGQGAQV